MLSPEGELADVGPALRVPAEQVYAERGRAVIVAVVVVVDEQVAINIVHDRLAAWSDNVAMRAEQNSATTLRHRDAAAINIWSGDDGRASYDDVIGAIDPITALIDRGKEIVVFVVMVDVGTFDGVGKGT